MLADNSGQVGCILPESLADSEASCTKAKLEQKWLLNPSGTVSWLWERIRRLFPSPVTQSSPARPLGQAPALNRGFENSPALGPGCWGGGGNLSAAHTGKAELTLGLPGKTHRGSRN